MEIHWLGVINFAGIDRTENTFFNQIKTSCRNKAYATMDWGFEKTQQKNTEALFQEY